MWHAEAEAKQVSDETPEQAAQWRVQNAASLRRRRETQRQQH